MVLAPSAPPTVVRTREEAEVYVASVCFKHGPPTRLGAELEWVVQHSGNPHRPLQAQHLADALGPHAPSSLVPDSPQTPLPSGSTVTVEPGGQLEISSPPCASLTELVATVDGDTATLNELLDPGLVLLASGADPYRPSRRLIDIPRYAAMETAFDRIGPMGRAMMCSTAAVQVCLDAGTGAEVTQRWAALHDLGPVLLAAFANSPWLGGRCTGWASSRMQAWFMLDPARTMPSPVDPGLAADWDPAVDWARRALDTPLLCQRRAARSWVVPTGVTFADWLSGALPGPPSTADLDYHLTTLFPPVRPRGHLEVRYLDAQPAGQWLVPVAVLAALLADPVVTDAARAACAPAVGRWFEAARHGLQDRVLGAAARAVFDLACRALPALDAPARVHRLVQEITERRVRRGRCPADESR
jgi:glutamate--cysteine ligase